MNMNLSSLRLTPVTPAIAVGLLLSLGAPAPSPAGEVGQELQDALLGGKINANIRYRYELVDQDGFTSDAKASTLRTRVGYTTGAFKDVLIMGEIEDLRSIGDDDYNSTVNGRTNRPVVADPEEYFELNQLWIGYQGIPDTTVKVGRQHFTFDNHRWIGDVNFRQNIQTYDAARITNKSLPDTTLDYIYVNKVHRIFGNESRQGNHGMQSHLFHGEYKGFELGALTGYAYILDYENGVVAGFPSPRSLSSSTFGARFKGGYPVHEKVKLLYTAEYAHQVDNADNPMDFSHNYFLGELGAKAYGVTGKVSFELLDGNGTNALQTPLATGHAFQGWADAFLVTPAVGIEDLYFTLITKVLGAKLIAVYHDFEADEGSMDLGYEYDFKVVYPFADYFEAEIKYANYDGEGFAGDRDKLWLALTAKY